MFNFTRNGKIVKSFETFQEAMDMLKNVAANDFSCDILEVQEVVNGKVVSYHDLNDEYWSEV
jgi:hypothetical protein